MRTKDQILRALFLCATDQCNVYRCPYGGMDNCHDMLCLDAADAIVRLTRDNKELAGSIKKQKLNSIYGEVHNAEQADKI